MLVRKQGAAARRGIVVVVAFFALIAGLTPATASAAPSYVALGDSYAAGPLTGMFLQPYGCLKSNLNYGHLARRSLGQPVYRDATCSGAETEDMTQAQGVTPGPNPPQFNSLDVDTRVVTITIGGNDIGFFGPRRRLRGPDAAQRRPSLHGQVRQRRGRRDGQPHRCCRAAGRGGP